MEGFSQPEPSPTRTGRTAGSAIELAVVFGVAVGVPLLAALLGRRGYDFGEQRLIRTLAAEALLVVTIWPWLRRRGWDFLTIIGAPEPLDVVRGLGLAVIAYLAYYFAAVTWATFTPAGLEQIQSAIPTGSAARWVVVLVSIVNPIVEESLWLGYAITALQRFGDKRAVLFSAGLRTLVHAYQGAMAVIGILPLGLVFGTYFVRTKRIWPVIVAHLLFDAIGLSQVVR